MGFSSAALTAVIALTQYSSVDSFALIPNVQRPDTRLALKFGDRGFDPSPRPLSVTLSSVDDIVGSADDDDDMDDDEVILSVGDLGDLESTDDESTEVLDMSPSPAFMHAEKLAEIRSGYKRHETDSGSPEFQVAGMTERITYLTQHLKMHPKDFSTRRGLVALVNKRRRLLNYLYREDAQRYQDLVKGLGIRHKAPRKFQTREEQYGMYPKQKTIKKHLQ